MKLMFLTVILFLINNKIYSQIEFVVDTLTIHYLVVQFNKNVYDEGSECGPYGAFDCSIENKTDSMFYLHPGKSFNTISFIFEGKKYDIKTSFLFFRNTTVLNDVKEITIKPGDKICCYTGAYLFCGSPIHKTGVGNYSREMKAILPSLKIIYSERGCYIQTNDIRKIRCEK